MRRLILLLAACGRVSFDPIAGDGATEPRCAFGPTEFDQVGSGTDADPFVLCSADQLTDLMTRGARTASYVVAQPIDMTGRPASPIGDAATPFSGDFDGGGHQIRGLAIEFPGDDVGLFGVATRSLHDLVLVDVAMHGAHHVGGLVGWLRPDATIARCSTTGTVTSDGDYAGGLVAVAGLPWIQPSDGAEIAASSSSATVTGVDFIGGLVGTLTGVGMLTDSYATGAVSGSEFVGGLVGGSTGVIASSFASGDVTGSGTLGGLTGSSGGLVIHAFAAGSVTGTDTDPLRLGALLGENFGLDPSNSFSLATATCTAPNGCHVLVPTAPAAQLADPAQEPLAHWNLATWALAPLRLVPRLPDTTWTSCADHLGDAPYAGGDGSQAFPFHLCTPAQLAQLASRPADWERYYAFRLDADLDLASAPLPGSIGAQDQSFYGLFDGRGHTISNLVLSLGLDRQFCGLFSLLSGRLDRLGVVDANIECGGEVGAIAGEVNHGVVRDVYATGTVQNHGAVLGGAFGDARSSFIRRSYFVGTVTGMNAGGFIARDYDASPPNGAVHDCFASATITAGAVTGPFAGSNVDPSNFYDPSTPCSGCNFSAGTAAASTAALFDPTQPPLGRWDFSTVWISHAPGGPPTLRSEL